MAKISKRDWNGSTKKAKSQRPRCEDEDWMGFDVRAALMEMEDYENELEYRKADEARKEFEMEDR